tara:strand:+ start:727 stop:1710 length:984 start_codon:yes stop_codon:yes gene_type:complete
MEQWKSEGTPWRTVVEMGHLTNLIYDYAKNWEINDLDNLSCFFENECGNEHLGDKDKEVLISLRDKYPDGKILKFFTNSADLQCVIGENPHKKRYTLVFRGSEGILDWLYDLMIIKITLFENVKVHRGFYKQLMHNGTFGRMTYFIKNLIVKHPDWEWYITGHSLGAALSTLSGYLFSRQFKDQRFTVVSLASPRVGNSYFRDSFNKQPNLRHYRVCNYRDCVTAMPMLWYCHVGKNLYFDSKKRTWFDYGFNIPFSYYLYNFWNPYDHSCSLYLKSLEYKESELNRRQSYSEKQETDKDKNKDGNEKLLKEISLSSEDTPLQTASV